MGGAFALNIGVNTARTEIEGDKDGVLGAKLIHAGALSLTAAGDHTLDAIGEGQGAKITRTGRDLAHTVGNQDQVQVAHGIGKLFAKEWIALRFGEYCVSNVIRQVIYGQQGFHQQATLMAGQWMQRKF